MIAISQIQLPKGWKRIQSELAYDLFCKFNGLKVLVSIEAHSKGDIYRHVSFSHRNKLPSWKEVKEVKNIFFGEDEEAYQVLPPQEKYINIHEYTLHLWSLENGDKLFY